MHSYNVEDILILHRVPRSPGMHIIRENPQYRGNKREVRPTVAPTSNITEKLETHGGFGFFCNTYAATNLLG